jgi:uncharacterized protein (TIRG00374 family)
MSASGLRARVLTTVLLGLLVSVGVAFYADAGEVLDAIRGFEPFAGLAAVALGLAAFVLRGWRWHWFLRRVGEPRISRAASADVYAAGFAMTVTPGRVGEWVKSYYVQALGGPPAARTAPIILAERITDMLGLVLLAAAGLFVYRTAIWVVAASGALALFLLLTLTHRPTGRLTARALARIPVLRNLVPHAEEFYASAAGLLTPRTIPTATAIAFASWVCEAAAYWCVLVGIGVEPSGRLMFQAAFIWPVASLAGGLFLTPGGLGVAEGGLAALGASLVDGLARGPAAAAALLARFATLWIGVGIGLLAMLSLWRRTRELPVRPRDGSVAPAAAPARTES